MRITFAQYTQAGFNLWNFARHIQLQHYLSSFFQFYYCPHSHMPLSVLSKEPLHGYLTAIRCRS